MTDLFADVNGIKICYDIHGEGDPVFLLHGFSDRKEHWRAQVGELSKHFKLIRMDNRGAGRSDRPNGEYTMEIFASDVVGLMDFLEIEKAHIIGHSMGGMIAQNLIILYPDRVRKMVLINTFAGIKPPGEPTDDYEKIQKKSAIAGQKAIENDPLNAFIKGAKASYSRNFWKMMREDPKRKFHGIWSVEDLIDEKIKHGPTPTDLAKQAHAIAMHNTYERLNEIKNEVLIIAAEKDKSCPVSANKKIHKLIPNSRFIVIEKAAHQSILEKPHEINKIIIEFLSK
ncbi:MAG: alpha/beta hydrolase [Promethearchaeota archaeon]|nr:MAG: alpha/beta hydrolase [Candidatus Lokiarchaeota archaeon]